MTAFLETAKDFLYTCDDCGAKMGVPWITTQPRMVVRCLKCYIASRKAAQKP